MPENTHGKTSLSLEENARTFQLKRKYVLVKTQVRLTPNVRAFSEGTKMSSLLNEYKGFLLLLDTLKNINQIKM